MVIVMVTGITIGPMKKAEIRTRQEDPIKTVSQTDIKEIVSAEKKEIKPSMMHLLLPFSWHY